jgi:hypothetical protein
MDPFMEKFRKELGESKKVTLEKGPKSRVQWNWAFLLIKSFKLVSRPLDGVQDQGKSNCNFIYMASL